MTAVDEPCHLIVLAGGKGSRVAHISRRLHGEEVPKQFCRFGAPRSLLQATVERFCAFLPPGTRTVVVATGAQRRLADRQLRRYRRVELMVQPVDRGTGAGLLLPLLEVAARAPDGVTVITPADHAFAEDGPLRHSVLRAADAVRAGDERIVVLGAEPDAPRPDFGWILPGPIDPVTSLRRVERFEEKPSAERAAELWRAGALWNTLVLVARARTLVSLYARGAADLLQALATHRSVPSAHRYAALCDAYARLEERDLSRDLLAAAGGMVVCPLDRSAGWTDLGTEDSLLEWMAAIGAHPLLPVARGELLEQGAESARGCEARRAALEL